MKNIEIDNKFTAAPVLFFALNVLFSSVSLMFNIHHLIFSMIIAIAAVIGIGLKHSRKILISCLIMFISVLISVMISGYIYDISYDGMSFHKEAVYALANGWNPWRTSFWYYNCFGRLQDTALWLDNYPKGVWSLYACIYSITGKIEYAKGINIIFILMLFFCSYDTLKRVFNKRTVICFLLAAVFTLNPVIVSQYFTFMNDLPVAVFVMICAFIGMKIYTDKADNWDYIILAAAFSSSFAVKFTAPVFCGCTLAGFGIAVSVKNKMKGLCKPCTVVIAAALAGVFILGADPYVKHILQGQNPVYPVLGEGKYDIINTNAPDGFENISNPYALGKSLFSHSAPHPGDSAVLKLPFSINKNDLWGVSAPDTRVGGFGVWFSGILILSAILGIFAALKSKNTFAVVPALLAFTILALFFPNSWWARYNPYIYYIPCLMLTAFSCIERKKAITAVMCCIFLINCGISGLAVLRRFYKETRIIKWKLYEMHESGQHVIVNINDFPGHEIWFNEYNLDFEIVWDFDGEPSTEFYGSTEYRLKP